MFEDYKTRMKITDKMGDIERIKEVQFYKDQEEQHKNDMQKRKYFYDR